MQSFPAKFVSSNEELAQLQNSLRSTDKPEEEIKNIIKENHLIEDEESINLPTELQLKLPRHLNPMHQNTHNEHLKILNTISKETSNDNINHDNNTKNNDFYKINDPSKCDINSSIKLIKKIEKSTEFIMRNKKKDVKFNEGHTKNKTLTSFKEKVYNKIHMDSKTSFNLKIKSNAIENKDFKHFVLNNNIVNQFKNNNSNQKHNFQMHKTNKLSKSNLLYKFGTIPFVSISSVQEKSNCLKTIHDMNIQSKIKDIEEKACLFLPSNNYEFCKNNKKKGIFSLYNAVKNNKKYKSNLNKNKLNSNVESKYGSKFDKIDNYSEEFSMNNLNKKDKSKNYVTISDNNESNNKKETFNLKKENLSSSKRKSILKNIDLRDNSKNINNMLANKEELNPIMNEVKEKEKLQNRLSCNIIKKALLPVELENIISEKSLNYYTSQKQYRLLENSNFIYNLNELYGATTVSTFKNQMNVKYLNSLVNKRSLTTSNDKEPEKIYIKNFMKIQKDKYALKIFDI